MATFLQTLLDELLRFFSIVPLWNLLTAGDFSAFLTFNGMKALLSPLIPFLLLLEIFRSALYQRFEIEKFKVPLLTYAFNRFVSRFISIAATAFCIGLFEPWAVFKWPLTWYGFVCGYIVWEFAHFVYHFLGHKVRLFWCLHSTHHAPENMNMSVTYSHFFLEAPYADIIRTSICMLLGVPPAMLFAIMFVDGMWGSFIHIGEGLLKDGRLGFLETILLTPAHHRVHHARNPLYMDTNFCNLLNVWDRLFGTLQHQAPNIPIEYGITRPINAQSFWDVNFGEFVALFRDIAQAPGLKNKFLYVFMPPGWSHLGAHKTAAVVRKAFLENKHPEA